LFFGKASISFILKAKVGSAFNCASRTSCDAQPRFAIALASGAVLLFHFDKRSITNATADKRIFS
jgi:hypothetical protein